MEEDYKSILLQKGLESISDEELKKFKFFIPEKVKMAAGRLKAADRTELAQLMVEIVGVQSALRETIKIFKKMQCNSTAKCLEKEKKKVDAKKKKSEKKKETKSVKKQSQVKKIPGVSAASRTRAIKRQAVSKVLPQSKKMKQEALAILDPNDNTGTMKLLVPGKQKPKKRKEGNKLGCTSSRVPKKKKNPQLKSGDHSGVKVAKAKKNQSK